MFATVNHEGEIHKGLLLGAVPPFKNTYRLVTDKCVVDCEYNSRRKEFVSFELGTYVGPSTLNQMVELIGLIETSDEPSTIAFCGILPIPYEIAASVRDTEVSPIDFACYTLYPDIFKQHVALYISGSSISAIDIAGYPYVFSFEPLGISLLETFHDKEIIRIKDCNLSKIHDITIIPDYLNQAIAKLIK